MSTVHSGQIQFSFFTQRAKSKIILISSFFIIPCSVRDRLRRYRRRQIRRNCSNNSKGLGRLKWSWKRLFRTFSWCNWFFQHYRPLTGDEGENRWQLLIQDNQDQYTLALMEKDALFGEYDLTKNCLLQLLSFRVDNDRVFMRGELR